MTTLFYILIFLATWHYFYENVIAPALRHEIRFNFFSLRDELRRLNFDGLSSKDQKIYELLDNVVCDIIDSMFFISFGNYFFLRRYVKERKEGTKETEKILSSIQEADNTRLIEINEKIHEHATKILLINSGGWAPYLLVIAIPFIIIVYVLRQFELVSNKISNISSRLVYSHSEFDDESSTPIGFV